MFARHSLRVEAETLAKTLHAETDPTVIEDLVTNTLNLFKKVCYSDQSLVRWVEQMATRTRSVSGTANLAHDEVRQH